MLTLLPENRRRGLPSIDGLVILNHRQTGQTEAVLDGKSVTAWRTGATGALAVKKLTDKHASSLGIVGCGVQGFYQGVCISAIRKIDKIFLFDPYKTKEKMEKFAEDLKKACDHTTEIFICQSSEQLLEYSDIIVTATFSNDPVLPDNPELLKGKCYIAVGSYKPYMKELPDSLFRLSPKIYADLPHACEESGDLSSRIENGLLKKEQVDYLHQVITGELPTPEVDTIIFKTVGMALVDIVAAEYLYQKALKLNKGTDIDF